VKQKKIGREEFDLNLVKFKTTSVQEIIKSIPITHPKLIKGPKEEKIKARITKRIRRIEKVNL